MGKASVDVAPAHAFMVVASSATVPSLAIKLTSSLHPPANTNTPASIASWIRRMRSLVHDRALLVGDLVHRAAIERDQITRHRMTPFSAACQGPHRTLNTRAVVSALGDRAC
jgi:hypothetical protein